MGIGRRHGPVAGRREGGGREDGGGAVHGEAEHVEPATWGECIKKTGKPPITTMWIDVSKGTTGEAIIRSRLVARDFLLKGDAARFDLFAAMPRLEGTSEPDSPLPAGGAEHATQAPLTGTLAAASPQEICNAMTTMKIRQNLYSRWVDATTASLRGISSSESLATMTL